MRKDYDTTTLLDPEALIQQAAVSSPKSKSNIMSASSNNTAGGGEESKPRPRLLHPSLHKLPQALRFQLAGGVNTINFMVLYWIAAETFKESYPIGTIYAVIYALCIPIGHAITSLIVFGWPKPYLPNLMSNVPIGLTGLIIGSTMTSFLAKKEFDKTMDGFMQSVGLLEAKDDSDSGEFYSSIVVQIVTGIWGYTLSNWVNGSKSSSSAEEDKKEL